MHRMRPRDDDEEDCNSQDVVSDEELEISTTTLIDALTTRIGGKEAEGPANAIAGPTHFQNSTAAIERNQDIWSSTLENKEAQIPSCVEPQAIDALMMVAKLSQRKEKEQQYSNTSREEERNPMLQKCKTATTTSVEQWPAKKRTERNSGNRLMLNPE